MQSTKESPEKDSLLEAKIDSIISRMTIEEKIGQLALRGQSSRGTGELSEELLNSVGNGEIGALLNVIDTANVRIITTSCIGKPDGNSAYFCAGCNSRV